MAMSSKFDRGVSVILCCYNSAERLTATLTHLSQQISSDDFNWEIILVDNASKDNTAVMASELWKNLQHNNVNLLIVNEPIPGQVFARKKGVIAANYDCVIFCDDDNWLDKNYICTAYNIMDSDRSIGVAGGQNYPVSDVIYPEWFDEYKDKYATGVPAAQSGDVSHRGFILGAGMVTRKSLFLQLNNEKYPSLLNGRDGEKLSTGDDFEYCKRALLRGYKLYYDERLKLKHFIPAQRLTIAYRDRLMGGIDEAGKVLDEYDLAIHIKKRFEKKNKFRLILLSPLRIFLSGLGLAKNRNVKDEKLTLYYINPLATTTNTIRAQIKKFIFFR
jgi:glycosyltransferase involved in cell wall biosynthesis